MLYAGIAPGAVRVSKDEGRRLYKEKQNAVGRVNAALRNDLIAGKLIAWGRRDSPVLPPMLLPSSAWNSLTFFAWEKSIVREPKESSVKIHDVRVYPVIEAPNAVEVLSGKTLVEVLKAHIWDDPEAAAARTAVTMDGGVPPPLGDNIGPHRAVWSVLQEIGKSAIGILRQDAEHDLKTNAQGVLAARYARLIAYLATGDLVAEGAPRSGGKAEPIPRAQWQRRNTYVDITNGDLLERNQNAKSQRGFLSKPLFSGLELRTPHALAAEDEGLKRHQKDRRRSGKSDAVRDAAEKAGIDFATTRLAPKAIASTITPHLTFEVRDEHADKALRTMIGRLLREARSP